MSRYGHETRFGVFVLPSNHDPLQPVRLARSAEQAGLDLVTFQDHPYHPGLLDTWTLLSWVAASTERITVAPSVLNLPLRPPAVVARAAASLDLLSGGRLELGLGAGAFWDGIAAMGGRHLAPGESVQALDEAIDVIRGVWDVEDHSVLDVPGFHHVHGARRGPRPAHDVELWIGGYRRRMLELTGSKGDGWLPSVSYLSSPEDLVRGAEVIDEAAQQAGRSPSAIRRLLTLDGHLPGYGGANTGFPRGSVRDWVEQLSDLGSRAGTSVFILASDEETEIEAFGREVAPAVRETLT